MRSALRKMGMLAGILALCLLPARAQDPAGADPSASGTGTQADTSTGQTAVPDTLPLSGAQTLTTGGILTRHSFLLPSLNVTAQADSNRQQLPVTSWDSVQAQMYLMGRIGLVQVSGRSELTLDYQGGRSVSVYQNLGDSMVHSLRLAETVRGRRWSLLLGGQGSYLSESAFGLGNAGGLDAYGVGSSSGFGGLIGGAVPAFQSGLLPSQSISTQNVERISATGIVQTSFKLNSRASLTFFGSYGILQFRDAQFFDSSQIVSQAGYEVQLSKKNTISINFRFGNFRFPGQGQEINTYVPNFSYARRLTGRLSWQISAGPQFLEISPVAALQRQMSWSASTALSYQLQRFNLGINYDHSITGGSGLLLGAETDQVQGTVSRQMNRRLRGSLAAGFANNQGVSLASVSAISGALQSWFGSARMDWRVGQRSNFFLAYNARLQGANTPGCLGSLCALTSVNHQVSAGFNLAFKPVVLH